MPVSFEELEGSPVIRTNEQGTLAQRTFRIAWQDWQEFTRNLVGSYSTVGCTFVFQRPIEFPDMPNLVVSELTIEPFDPANPSGSGVSTLVSATNQYLQGGALVTAIYRTTFDSNNRPRPDLPAVPDGTYLTYQADLGTQTQSIPGRVWHWIDPPDNSRLPPDVNLGLIIPAGNYRLTWHRVALPPWTAIRDLRGKVNNATFLGSPPETVLFLGARLRRKFQFAETGGFWTLEYEFLERTLQPNSGLKVGWNHQYKEKPVSSEHWVAVADDSGNSPYASGDLNQLFQFGTTC